MVFTTIAELLRGATYHSLCHHTAGKWVTVVPQHVRARVSHMAQFFHTSLCLSGWDGKRRARLAGGALVLISVASMQHALFSLTGSGWSWSRGLPCLPC